MTRTTGDTPEDLGSLLRAARSGCPDHHPYDAEGRVALALRRPFSGPLIIDGGFEPATGAAGIERDEVDRMAHGVKWLANLDLPERWKRAARLKDPVRETFLGRGCGYVDHPALAQLDDGPMAPVRALSNPSAEAR
jgi:2,4-dienoyl-CoA reductase-like NADH-dependent reductase (Old Yellow Enzyme family)